MNSTMQNYWSVFGTLGILLHLIMRVGSQTCSCVTGKKLSNSSKATDVIYEGSLEHIVNPERGFMTYKLVDSANPNPISKSQLDGIREEDGINTIWIQWMIGSFIESDISAEFLEFMRNDLLTIRNARYSAIVRVYYTNVYVEEAPYGDATKQWMLRHIEQVAPVLNEYKDVIITVQAGFIGIWGEWYYTTHFGDPNYLDCSDPELVKCLTPENWQDRHEVLQALLDIIHPNTTIAIRYPCIKYHLLNDQTPTVEEDMLNLYKKYRISHHNDCFVSSPNDVGTYIDYEKEYPYLQQDLLYSNIGGETCRIDEETNRHVCINALKEMEELHYTYLNQDYNSDVTDMWKRDGCYDVMHRLMGYRLVLVKGTFEDTVVSGGDFCFSIALSNIGFAAPVKNKDVEIVFLDNQSGIYYSAQLPDVDVRTWLPNTNITLSAGVNVPLQPGSYDLFLAIKPHSWSLTASLSDYNILTANKGTPDYRKGLNSLQFTVQVISSNDDHKDNNNDRAQQPMACPILSEMNTQIESEYSRRYCEMGQCDSSSCHVPIENPSFETSGVGWIEYEGTFEYTTETASHGIQSIKMTDGAARQTWIFGEGMRSFNVTADSKNEGMDQEESYQYSIYCDIKLLDGSWDYGLHVTFQTGNSDWHTRTLVIHQQQDIAEAWCYARFLDFSSGTAYFDNFIVTC